MFFLLFQPQTLGYLPLEICPELDSRWRCPSNCGLWPLDMSSISLCDTWTFQQRWSPWLGGIHVCRTKRLWTNQWFLLMQRIHIFGAVLVRKRMIPEWIWGLPTFRHSYPPCFPSVLPTCAGSQSLSANVQPKWNSLKLKQMMPSFKQTRENWTP